MGTSRTHPDLVADSVHYATRARLIALQAAQSEEAPWLSPRTKFESSSKNWIEAVIDGSTAEPRSSCQGLG
jgi:hypothetical protein